VGKAEFAVVEF